MRSLPLICLLLGPPLLGQYGGVDPTFNPVDDGTYGDGPLVYESATWDHTPVIQHIHHLPDGRILLAGRMQAYDSLQAQGIVRVFADGRVDNSFVTDLMGSLIQAMVVLDDGRILLGGSILVQTGSPARPLVCLLPDGEIDPLFDPPIPSNALVKAMLLQPDGKVIIVGDFTIIGGTPRNRIARLHLDGSLDLSFDPGQGISNSPNTLALQVNGDIVVGGSFGTVDGVVRMGIARLTTMGALDPDFDPAGNTQASTTMIHVDTEGRILILGTFSQVNGTPAPRIARLLGNGNIDPDFDPGNGPSGTYVEMLHISELPDGKLLVGGQFAGWDGTDQKTLVRLHPDGSIDTVFDARFPADHQKVFTARHEPDGSILVGGSFYRVASHSRTAIARLQPNGELDLAFNPRRGPDVWVNMMEVLPDGRILIAGLFESYNDIPRPRLALLTPDGLLDESFQPDAWVDQASVFSMLPISGQRILLGNNSPDPLIRLRCLQLDGNDCMDFDAGQGPLGTVYAMAELPDGRFLVAGSIVGYDGQSVDRIARLLPDGSLDASFVGPGTVNGTIRRMAVRPDDRILIAGSFTTISGQSRPALAQLHPDGTLDTGFNAGPIAGTMPNGDTPVEVIVPQEDGSVLVGGCFNSFGGSPQRKGIVRIDASGSVVPGFNTYFPPSWHSYFVTGMSVHDNGRIVITGWFLEYGGHATQTVARLLPNGDPDITFSVGDGPWGWTIAPRLVRIQQVDHYIVAGQFIRFGGIPAHRIARIHGGGGVGIHEIAGAQSLHTWPNPVQDVLHFEQPAAGRVFDAQGRAVLDLPKGATQNVGPLRPGMYILRTMEGSVLRFVKE